jgi:aspartyl/asparaginyl-tRNA synthetase
LQRVLPYTEAIEILQKAVAKGVDFEGKPVWGMDLPSEYNQLIVCNSESQFGQAFGGRSATKLIFS